MSLPKPDPPKKKPYPDFSSRAEKIRYGVFMASFPSIAIIAIMAMILNFMNAENDFDRTDMMIAIYNNTHIGIENLMIENCEQDAQINALLGFEVDMIEKELANCLSSIPFLNPPDGIEVNINEGHGEA